MSTISPAASSRAFDGPAGVYNLADDHPCAQNEVVAYGCALLGVAPPPLLSLEEAGSLTRRARAFYAENRRVANGKARRAARLGAALSGLSRGASRLPCGRRARRAIDHAAQRKHHARHGAARVQR